MMENMNMQNVNTEIPNPTKKDFLSDQEVKWCPGCGDYSVLNSVATVLPDLNYRIEDVVFVSGIGCSSRFPYYVSTYGFHGIHGRGSAIATGIKLANPKLSVWQITGDGDCLAIGGNHFIHVVRKNIDINILIFNNKIYGLTKGQVSPTTPKGAVTKTTPDGSIDKPFRPGILTIGAQGDFFARVVDTNPKLMQASFKAAALHKGTSVVEILQNCVIFNNQVHAIVTAKEYKDDHQLHLKHGEPMLFGKEKEKGIRLNKETMKLEVVKIGENGITLDDILVHDEQMEDPWLHLKLIQMHPPEYPLALGVIRAVPSTPYEVEFYNQMEEKKKKSKIKSVTDILNSGEIYEIN